ncbi:extracellular solute-binding protein [Microbacterium sp. BK668]|uniref:sugar ABC transporter substrate-binding protein n=1 Tax=Microbacterium sp. BK668 TaxID=2512118 RepID=UPI0010616581|nr:extracellular solute-binding protein [Microbacterium sp. BK668]TDN92267.1 carbohydrate ABC transporter substrate-binding protein (CUT1 family) [Microbacterium sp. BK668]
MKRHTAARALALGAFTATAALALAGCGQGFDDGGSTGEGGGDDSGLTILIGSSGDAETDAVTEAVAAWSEESGTPAEVTVASDLNQQLSQGFAAGDPPDLFYLSTEALAGYAANGSLQAYGDDLENKDDFYPSLVENFTYEDQFYCAPKDFSTLALIINKGLWDAAGLTEADIPTTWDELASVAQTLTKDGVVGLGYGWEWQRLGTFMAQAGGGLVEDGEPIANSQENVDALTYVQDQMAAGTFAYAQDLGAGWGGEAFGKQLSAMTIEGNWIQGAMANDYPDVEYIVAELPEGPAGKGTLQFTNCWGMAADSSNQEAALDLVQYLTSTEQQLAFSQAFGVMPSIQSAAEQWKTDNPDLAAFIAGADYAQGIPTYEGTADVITDFNSQLQGLKDGDPQQILDTVQSNLEAIVG